MGKKTRTEPVGAALMPTQVDLIKKYALSIRGHSGQHILIDPNIVLKILELIAAEPEDVLLEIGPGLGALTQGLLRLPVHLAAIEKDEIFFEILKAEIFDPASGRPFQSLLIREDFLKWDFASFFKKQFPGRRKIKVVSNLPYYITAPILFRLLECRPLLSSAVLMIQKEVARRLLASPGTKDYGRLTLALQYGAEVEHAFDVPATCFTPKPQVDSSVVVLKFRPEKNLLRKEKERFLFDLIQTAFSQRRKTLLNLLCRGKKPYKGREEMLRLFEALGLPEDIRGEKLSLKDFMTLTGRLFL